MAIKLYPHQTKALREMAPGKILAGEVGSGKTITALAFWYIHICGGMPKMAGVDYQPMTTPKDLYVFTTAKKRNDLDWEGEAANFGVGRESNEHGVQMHVDSWNNLSQYDHVEGAFFIFDEQRLVGNGSWVKSFLKIAKSNQWIMLSGTPGDAWVEYCAVFLGNGFYKNRTEFFELHVELDPYVRFPKIKKYHNVSRLERQREAILVDMPFARHTSRHERFLHVPFDRETFELVVHKRWNPYEGRPIRDVAELQVLMRKVVNSDVSRLAGILELLENHPRLIVFYNFNYELEILRTLQNVLAGTHQVAEYNGKKHQPVPRSEKWVYLVQYTAGAEGWNCIETNAIAFYSLNYSWKIFEQCKGRIDRLNTKYMDLYYYILRSTAQIDQSIWKALTTKQAFNERKFAQKVWDAYDLAA